MQRMLSHHSMLWAACSGLIIGSVIGAGAASPVWLDLLEPISTMVLAFTGGLCGAGIAISMQSWHGCRLPCIPCIVVICFCGALLIPWFDNPIKGALPLGAAYLNPGWSLSRVMMAHMLLTGALTLLALPLCILAKEREPERHTQQTDGQ